MKQHSFRPRVQTFKAIFLSDTDRQRIELNGEQLARTRDSGTIPFLGGASPPSMLTPSGETSALETRPLGTISPTVLHIQGTRAMLMLREFGVQVPASNRMESGVELRGRVHKTGLIPSVDTPELNARILAAMRAVHEAVTALEARRSLSTQGHLFAQRRLLLLVDGPLETPPGVFDDAAQGGSRRSSPRSWRSAEAAFRRTPARC